MNKRLAYIDCLRGLSMLMVIYSHLLSFSMGGIAPSPIGQFMRELMLPLFFFISGFCTYKNFSEFSLMDLGELFVTKTRAILIPTIVMFSIFILYTGNDFVHYAMSYDKSGYWFTWVLFQILLIYIIFDFMASYAKYKWVKIAVVISPLFIMAAIFHFTGYESREAIFFEWIKVKGYYLYFIMGVFVRCYSDKLNVLLSNRYCNFALLAIAIFTYKLIGRVNTLIFSVLIIYYIFMQMDEWLSKENNLIGKCLNFIGKHTLAIYFIHFFLLFRVPVIPDYLLSLQTDACFGTNSCSSIVEFMICRSLSTIISYACIGIQNVLKKFPIAYELCLGPIKQKNKR